MFKKLINTIMYAFISRIVRKDEKAIVLGSWKGESFTDNSRYFAEYIIKNHPDYKVYWVGKKTIEKEIAEKCPEIIFLEKDKFKTNVAITKAKYCLFSQKYHIDISKYNLMHNTITCYLHHGVPIKKWGDDGLNQLHRTTKFDKWKGQITGSLLDYDYYASSSPLNTDVLLTAMKTFGCTRDKVLSSGTPRDDMLVNYDDEFSKERKDYYSDIIDYKKDQKIVLYLPTYRRVTEDIFSLAILNNEQRKRLEEVLEKYNAVIIEKSHFAEKVQFDGYLSENIKFVNQGVNVQEMYLFTDILISDYSSALLDYLLLNRPIIDFIYDYEEYKNVDSGLYYDIEDYYAGEVARNFNELLIALERILSGDDAFANRRAEMREKYMKFETGHASEIIFDKVIKQNSQKNKS